MGKLCIVCVPNGYDVMRFRYDGTAEREKATVPDIRVLTPA